MAGTALFAVLFFVSAGVLIWQYENGRQSAASFDAVASLAQPDTPPDPIAPDGPADEGHVYAEGTDPAMTAFEKYAAVFEQNADTVGWIHTMAPTSITPSNRG